MSAILAVDGGQSGIRMRHSGSTQTIEVDGITRSQDTVAALAFAISNAWTVGGFSVVERVVLGLTAAPDSESDSNRLCELVSATTGASEVWVADDTVTAHCGALSGEPGVCLVVGTGVACLAVPAFGDPRRFDGHGYLLGDEGGAFWIGRRALGSALRSHDRGKPSALTELVRSRFGSLDGLHIRLHESHSPVNDIAQFARDVIAAADNQTSSANPREEVTAATVVDEAAALLASTTLDAVAAIEAEQVPVALGGRLLEGGSRLRAVLDFLLASHPRISVQSAAGSPLDGALRLGEFNTPSRYRNLVHIWKAGRVA